MQFKIVIALLAICALTSGTRVPSAEHHFSKLLHQSRDAIQANPADAFECFLAYYDDFTVFTATYENDIKECLGASENAVSAINDATAEQRSDLISRSESGCAAAAKCKESIPALEFFQCSASTATAARTAAYDINANANQLVLDINLWLDNINAEKKKCDTTCQQTYEKSMDASYRTLQECQKLNPAAVETKAQAVKPKVLHSNVMKQALSKH